MSRNPVSFHVIISLSKKRFKQVVNAFGGFMGGLIAGIVLNPIDVAKTRAQDGENFKLNYILNMNDS